MTETFGSGDAVAASVTVPDIPPARADVAQRARAANVEITTGPTRRIAFMTLSRLRLYRRSFDSAG
jgi:hypothetical protein